jgi:hypothetical protein
MPSDPNFVKILLALRDRAMDGYSLQRLTGLDDTTLLSALWRLQSQGIVNVKGELSKDKLGDAYFSLVPGARGLAEMIST